jgi:hypothetical protein
MSKCKYCGIEGEWQQTQYGNRLFVNGEMHKCPNYQKAKGGQQGQQFGNRETSNTYVPQGGYITEDRNKIQQLPAQIPIPQPAPEPAILTQMQTTLEAIQVALKDLKKGQELMSEKIDTLYHQAMSE